MSAKRGHSTLRLGISTEFGHRSGIRTFLLSHIWPCGPVFRRFPSNLVMRPTSEHSFSATCGHSALRSGIPAELGYAASLQNTFSQPHVAIWSCAWRVQPNSAMRPALKHSFSVTSGHLALHLGISVQFGYAALLQNTLSQSLGAIRLCIREISVQFGHAACFETLFLSHIWPFGPAFRRFQPNLAMRPALEHSFSVTWGHSALYRGISV